VVDFQHVSVLPKESILALNIKPTGIYVDGTLGGGGHSALILQSLTTGRLIGIDQDKSAIEAASEKLKTFDNFQGIHGNFHDMANILKSLDISQVDGVLLDLGISSHQIDTPDRGFSFRFEGPLDMRMDKNKSLTAREIVNTYEEKEIADILFTYGEERNSRKIARGICEARKTAAIETTLELSSIIERTSPPYHGVGLHPSTRSFMALRIAVNDELTPLEGVLREVTPLLSAGGRFAIITFHSLEDRIVKKTFASMANPCECPRDIPYCVCGKEPSVKVVTRKPMLPTKDELLQNRRAHSAKLRIAEKI